ncbi:MAG: sigma-70 family RNA polymerase sigma factor [Chitinophagaceae bacterium]|nr:sigma-70 family RNA polymerase sigma factor [Chitinophagaceae bacterium]
MTDLSLHIDKALAHQIAGGDEAAFAKLFKAFWPQVYGVGLRITRSPEQAKDLAQEIFIKVWDNRDRLPEVKKIDAFIYVVSRNLILDHLRKKVFQPANMDFLLQCCQTDAVDAQDKLEVKELEQKIDGAIQTLPGKVQEVFKLSRFEGMTHEQIARKLNISVVSSKTYVVRALDHIRRYLSTPSEQHLLIAAIILRALIN